MSVGYSRDQRPSDLDLNFPGIFTLDITHLPPLPRKEDIFTCLLTIVNHDQRYLSYFLSPYHLGI